MQVAIATITHDDETTQTYNSGNAFDRSLIQKWLDDEGLELDLDDPRQLLGTMLNFLNDNVGLEGAVSIDIRLVIE